MKIIKFIPILIFLAKSAYSFYKKKRPKVSSNKSKTSTFKRLGSKNNIARLYHNRISDAILTAQGTVVRILSDDFIGDRHQRFIVKISGTSLSVLIAHNIDMAQRLSIKKGDFVKFKGKYEWNERGGIIHWTHHDPKGWREGGWIEANNKRVE